MHPNNLTNLACRRVRKNPGDTYQATRGVAAAGTPLTTTVVNLPADIIWNGQNGEDGVDLCGPAAHYRRP